jgi:hypothetical protein
VLDGQVRVPLDWHADPQPSPPPPQPFPPQTPHPPTCPLLPQVIKLISQVIADFADGEISQAASLFDTSIDLPRYLDKSFWKTASLIAASCRSAAVFSDCSPEGGPAAPAPHRPALQPVLASPDGWVVACAPPHPCPAPRAPCPPPPSSQGEHVRVRQAPGAGLPGGGRHPRLHPVLGAAGQAAGPGPGLRQPHRTRHLRAAGTARLGGRCCCRVGPRCGGGPGGGTCSGGRAGASNQAGSAARLP